IPCSDIPAAQRFVEGLKPGPNTEQAKRHLEAAKAAKSDQGCDKELRLVDKYARRSAAADKRAAKEAPAAAQPTAPATPAPASAAPATPAPAPAAPPKPAPTRPVECADWLHQDRPGGSDYHGPPVAGCPRR